MVKYDYEAGDLVRVKRAPYNNNEDWTDEERIALITKIEGTMLAISYINKKDRIEDVVWNSQLKPLTKLEETVIRRKRERFK